MIEELIKKNIKLYIEFKMNNHLINYMHYINFDLIRNSYDEIINFIAGEVATKYFDNTSKTENYFQSAYEELYKSINNEGALKLDKSIKILKWYYGYGEKYKELEKIIKDLHKARNKLAHTNQIEFKSFSNIDETIRNLRKINEIIIEIIK